MSDVVLRARHIYKSYRQGPREIPVLSGINLSVERGQSVSLMGQSGSGKSTLISILAALDEPTSGELELAGRNPLTMRPAELAQFRAQEIGIVFQQFHLLPHLNALENVRLPLDFIGRADASQRARAILEQLHLDHRSQHFPSELSRGECQRVAIGRVLVMRPSIVFADEPTGSLDKKTADEIIQLIFHTTCEQNIALVMATHDSQIASHCAQHYRLQDGQLS